MGFFVLVSAAIAFGFLAFDMILGRALKLLSRYWPNDVAGPDGWLIDTRARNGAFDR
ncbi:hypothetical protein [Pseudaestuariivita sp.]|uniref:hypothetical protein n=1 Tax=Pseudaestuariivita sp. TaxID=2211669 RepID=UPI004058522E